MHELVTELLISDVNNTAEWRDRKSEEHPDDDRNAKAANRLRELAAGLQNLDPDHPLLAELHGFWVNDKYEDETHMFSEIQSALLRDIGFRTDFESGEKFLVSLIQGFRGEIEPHAEN